MVDDNGVDSITRVSYSRDGVKIIEPTIHRLKVRLVCFLHPHRVCKRVGLEIKHIDILPIAYW